MIDRMDNAVIGPISIIDGTIFVGTEGTPVGRNATRIDFENSKLYREVSNLQSFSNGHYNYRLSPQIIGRKLFGVTIYFLPNDFVSSINFSFLLDGKYANWEEWSEETEMIRKKVNDRWLRECLGNPPYEYSWGGISSEYEPRSGSSSIMIRYNRK